MRRLKKILFSRAFSTIFILLLELLWILAMTYWLRDYLGPIEALTRLGGFFIILTIINYSRHLSADLMWVVSIALFPVAGTIVFLFLYVMDRFSSRTYRAIKEETKTSHRYYIQNLQTMKEAREDMGAKSGQLNYISQSAGFPIYRNVGYDYYALGSEAWPHMLEELEKAKRFIFLEYFIIEPGHFWGSILSILKEKAADGVEVRVLYDDLGSINTLPIGYADELEKCGIKASAFNRVSPVINGIMNHRDHRKILVIDGKVAFTGGINLADEYVGLKITHGHWKDNCVRIRGEAVWSMTVMFLTTWNALRHEDEDYTKYYVNQNGIAQKDILKIDEMAHEKAVEVIRREKEAAAAQAGRRNYSGIFHRVENNILGDDRRRKAGVIFEDAMESVEKELPALSEEASCDEADGWVAPYGESPLEPQLVGQNIYINILNQATKYVYIFTPYLIIDTDMENALILAAERGVDVRIITPGVPDKKMIWRITRSYYRVLIRSGVKIYEYTPGFDHAKVFVSDDDIATVGTLNLDYRSLYLHFENGTYLCHSREVLAIRDDLLAAIEQSRQMNENDAYIGIRGFFYQLLRLFAPMM